MLLLLVGCAAFVAGGVFVLPTKPVAAYAAIVFFGLGVVVALVNLLPGSSYLELEQRGFTMCTFFRKSFHRWEDVAAFFPLSVEGTKPMVALRYAPSYQGARAIRRFATQLTGAEGALPDTYGMSAADLAALLNKVRVDQSQTF
ncbi:MAG TPA: hypothetical protein VGK95_14975 [Caldimonas sp.]|jgi:hypothetical protein